MNIKKLSEIVDLQKGKKPEISTKGDGNLPYLTAKYIRGEADPEYGIPNSEGSVVVSHDDYVIILDGSNSGEVFTGLNGILASTMGKLVLNEKIHMSYLGYFLDSNRELFGKTKTGSAIPHLSKDIFFNLNIPVPPFQEQEKIVERLDKVFKHISTQIKNIKTQLDFNSLIFESYFEKIQSNFRNSGTISEFFDLATGGTPSKKNKDYFNNGSIPWLLSGDIHQENIFESKNFITEDALKKSNAKYLPIGSVLIALNGQGKTRGSVAQLKINATCNQSLISINSKDHNVIKNEFLFYYLKSQYKNIRKLTGDSGNDRRGLNMKIINSMLVKFPELSVQNKVVDNCKSLTEINKNLTKILDNKMNKYAKLKNSILNKEFYYE